MLMHELRRSGTRGRITLRRVVVAILATMVTMYLGAVVYLMSQETRLVFQAGRGLGTSRPSVPYKEVSLTRSDGGPLFAWTLEHDRDEPWVLFLHGNDATIGSRVNVTRYDHLYALGVNVMAPEYRGFAGLSGVPNEHGVSDDARTAYQYLRSEKGIPPGRIVIYGWSLGSAIAVNLASTVQEAGLILEGAPASLVAIGQRRYPLMPVRLVMRNPFDSIVKIQSVHAPILFIHSPEDKVIPIAEGRRLYDAAPSPRTFVEVRGGHVNSSDVDPDVFYGAIDTFLREHGLTEIADHGPLTAVR
jgi:uncharacterized protein